MQGRRFDPNSPLPRYYQIYSALLAMIEAGELAVGEALPPERAIAEAFGVARPTVVRALELLERDGRIEKQQGRGSFVLEPPAADANTSWTLAFISSPSITYELMLGISQTAFEQGCHLQLFSVDFAFRNMAAYVEACLANGVDGFLVYGRPSKDDAAVYGRLIGEGVPLVMVDRYYPELECDWVVYDNEAASCALVNTLLARGHERVAIIPGFELETTAVRDRLSGYRRALEENDLTYEEDLVWLGLYDQRSPSGVVNMGGQAKLRENLERYQPTALVTINDLIADYAVHDLLVLQSGQTPKGWADAPELATFSGRVELGLSYLAAVAVHPTERLGRAAAKLLIERLNGSVTGAAHHQVIPMDIAERPQGVRQFV